MDYKTLYTDDFENYVADELRKQGFGVVQNIYIEVDGEGEAQIDIIAFDFINNVAYVVEVKSWDNVHWVSNQLNDRDWVYQTETGVEEKHVFNPHMQCQYQITLLHKLIAALFGEGFYFNNRVIFKYGSPSWSGCVATSAQEGILLTGGKSSKRSLTEIFDTLKEEQDFTEASKDKHKAYLEAAKEGRYGPYGKKWQGHFNYNT